MIHICKKKGCPRRFAIGSEEDKDVSAIFCPECQKLYYYSPNRTRNFFRIVMFLLLFLIFSTLIYFLKDSIADLFDEKPTIESVENSAIFTDKRQTIKVGETFIPSFTADLKEPYTINFGNGDKFNNTLPTNFAYDTPGDYEVTFRSGDQVDTLKVTVVEPVIVAIDESSETSQESEQQGTTSIKEEKPWTDVNEPEKLAIPLFDCPTLNLNFGTPCDDLDPNTINDVVGLDCKCSGIKDDRTYFYSDVDLDGKGAADKGKLLSSAPTDGSKWVENSSDRCPNRHGKGSVNGCPSIEILTVELTYGEPIEIQTTDFDLLAGDKVKWTSTDLKFTSTDIIDPLVESKKYGKVSVSLEIDGVENQKFTDSQILCSKISKNQLELLLDPVIKRGQFDPENYVPPSVENLADEKRTEIIQILGRECKVKKSNIVTGLEIGDFIDSNLMTKGSYVVAAKVKSLKYDLKTCTVTSINVDLQK